MAGKATRISDEAVQEATGRTWSQWREWLDTQGAGDMPHRDIVALLRDTAGLESRWWQQMVSNTYEHLTGRRIRGETAEAGFQVGVQRTVAVGHQRMWDVLTSPEGLRWWLGDGAGAVQLSEGARYELADGSSGQVRVVRPGGHLRVTWHPEGWPRPSTIQARVMPKGEKTVVGFHEEHLPGPGEREERRTHFRAALDRLVELAGA
ncbi:MAG TPA: SRPBCC domain-containing protein [Longimicrobiales bacterium]|nr:SRPBCC domain-containing protein [Longimicrobiales bacterium]